MLDFIKGMKIGVVFYWMLLFIPISLLLAIYSSNKVLIFITSILAIIPLARIIGYATEEICIQSNPTVGGLISATFGNFIELIIAVLALSHGLIRLVQASIIGSILGNLLLLIGLSVFFGGLRFKHQHFNREAVSVSSTMLIIALVGMTIPSLYAFASPEHPRLGIVSDSVAIVMALIYIAGLYFSLKTHKEIFASSDEIKSAVQKPTITRFWASVILFIAICIVAVESELLVTNIQESAIQLGMSQTFIGIIIIAIITNIAEKSIAINFAMKNKLDISIEIGLTSAIQIALFVVPILIIISQIFGYGFFMLFSVFEVVSVMLAVMIINHLAADGKCNWLEGAQLVSVYAILAIVFAFI